MNCLSNAPSYAAALFRRASQVISRSYLNGFPKPTSISYRASENGAACTSVTLGLMLSRYSVRCYSSKRSSKASSKVKNFASEPEPNEEKDAFFVVRKGDVVGVYRNFRDCFAQGGSSVFDPPISVYKGYILPKDTEDYLASQGLKNAIYTIEAADLTDDLFGLLSPCPLQEPASIGNDEPKEISQDAVYSCTIAFDGASKGNPGKAGAGAVLRSVDGNLICRVFEGAGNATCNAAEYRGIILGLKHALERGYSNIQVQGDSKFICMQVKGLWIVRNKNLASLHKVVRELKQKFDSFEICNVSRAQNSEADALANKGVDLADGQIEEECVNAIQIT